MKMDISPKSMDNITISSLQSVREYLKIKNAYIVSEILLKIFANGTEISYIWE